MLRNKKGAALLQVLLVAAVLAGLATMLLRVSVARTNAARHTYRTVSAQLLISRCQAEVNALWSGKTEVAFARDLAGCKMYCKTYSHNVCSEWEDTYTCSYTQRVDGQDIAYTGTATIGFPNNGSQNDNGQCELTYEVTEDNTSGAEVAL